MGCEGLKTFECRGLETLGLGSLILWGVGVLAVETSATIYGHVACRTNIMAEGGGDGWIEFRRQPDSEESCRKILSIGRTNGRKDGWANGM